MVANLTTADEILKINYEGPIREQLPNEQVLLAHIKKDATRSTFTGRQSLIPIHTTRNVGRGARAESGALPSSGNQGHEDAIYNMSYNYGKISVTGPAISASKTNEGAFARILDVEMKGLKKDMLRDFNRQLWHNGGGALCFCLATSSAQTINVTHTKFLEVGMEVDVRAIVSGTAVANGTSVTITSVDRTNHTFTFTSTAFATTESSGIPDHAVYLSGATRSSWSGAPVEMWGLEAIVSEKNPGQEFWDGNSFVNIDEFTASPAAAGQLGQLNADPAGTVVETWQANVVNKSGAAWGADLDEMQEAYDTSEIEAEVTPGLILTSHAMRRWYGSQLQGNRRYGGEVKLESGWSGLEFANSTIIADRDASWTWNPRNDVYTDDGTDIENSGFNGMYFLAPSSLEWHVLEDLQWEDTGGILVRAAVGDGTATDTYEAFMKIYSNLICTRRNANTLLVGDPTG